MNQKERPRVAPSRDFDHMLGVNINSNQYSISKHIKNMSPKHKHYICELDFVFHLADFCKSFFFTKVDCDIKLNKEIKSADAASAPADETALTAAGLMETTVVIIRVRKFGLVQLHLS